MADGLLQVDVDARKALARFSPSGIPESVRKNLRSIIPDLTRRLGTVADSKFDTLFKSRTHILIKKEMREDPTKVTGVVSAHWTGAPSASMVPQILETGARAHEIKAKNANALYFFWAKLGRNVAFKRVWHPGFTGRAPMASAFAEMRDEITADLRDAVIRGANQ